MSQTPNPSTFITRPNADPTRRVLPQRREPVLQPAQPRLPFRVLQTSRAPAQLSLWLRAELDLR